MIRSSQSLRDNILFDRSMLSGKFERTVKACALESDMEILASGVDTEIGENGINLSGGQKQRVSLARAVYAGADLYLLDDPLSAVDAHVGKHIFEEVISSKTGLLKDTTRILVTHSVSFLAEVDLVVVMRHGRIAELGHVQELMAKGGAFADFLNTYSADVAADAEGDQFKDDKTEADGRIGLERMLSKESEALSVVESARRRALSVTSSLSSITSNEERQDDKADDDQQGQLIEAEKAAVGRVSMGVYLRYVASIGYGVFGLCLILYVAGQSLHATNSFMLSKWADENEERPEDYEDHNKFYLSLYAGLGVVEGVAEWSREILHYYNCARASKALHESVLFHVLRSPMSFFDTTPNGRIVNRFSADVNTIDQTIPNQLNDFLWCLCDVVAVLVVICISTPIFMSVVLPLFAVYYVVQTFYIATSRQLKRLESISKSPVFAHFSESIQGAASIRAYAENDRFVRESEERVQINVRSFYLSVSSNRWLGMRIEILGNFVVLFASLFAVIEREELSPGLAGLSISYALNIIDTLNWTVRMACELETNAVALERLVEYTANPQEAEWEVEEEDCKVPSDWPREGAIQFDDYQTRYREGLELVIKGVSMNLRSMEKIGLCGRTGAGKSSLTLALFRIVEPAGGAINIDGVNVTRLGLHKLRSSITIIPQDPVLFTGDIR